MGAQDGNPDGIDNTLVDHQAITNDGHRQNPEIHVDPTENWLENIDPFDIPAWETQDTPETACVEPEKPAPPTVHLDVTISEDLDPGVQGASPDLGDPLGLGAIAFAEPNPQGAHLGHGDVSGFDTAEVGDVRSPLPDQDPRELDTSEIIGRDPRLPKPLDGLESIDPGLVLPRTDDAYACPEPGVPPRPEVGIPIELEPPSIEVDLAQSPLPTPFVLPAQDPPATPERTVAFATNILTDGNAQIGNPTTVVWDIRAYEDLTGVTVRVLDPLDVVDPSVDADLPSELLEGSALNGTFPIVPVRGGETNVSVEVSAVGVNGPYSQTTVLHFRVPVDPNVSGTVRKAIRPWEAPLLDETLLNGHGATTGQSPTLPSEAKRKPEYVVFIHGVDSVACCSLNEDIKSSNHFGDARNALAHRGWDKTKMYTVGYYECDEGFDLHVSDFGKGSGLGKKNYGHGDHQKGNDASQTTDHRNKDCQWGYGNGADRKHNTYTSIQHIGYHFAWTLYYYFTAYGDCVNVVAHSMGGLITGYALHQVELKHPDFPSTLCVDDVVTLGTPHGGSGTTWASAQTCNANYYGNHEQCGQMEPNSAFMTSFTTNSPDYRGRVRAPDVGTGGTDWTTMGSDDDGSVSNAEAKGSIAAEHHIRYHSDAHVDHTGSSGWYDDKQQDPEGFWTGYTTTHFEPAIGDNKMIANMQVGKAMDMSLAYDYWGCGYLRMDSLWEVEPGRTYNAEPLTTSSHSCAFKVDVPSLTYQLRYTFNDMGNADQWPVMEQNAAGSGSYVCNPGGVRSSYTCIVTNPTATTYVPWVYNQAGKNDPYSIRVDLVPHDLDDTTIYYHPSGPVTAGTSFWMCWYVAGSGSVTHTNLHYGTSSGSYGSVSTSYTGTASMYKCQSFTMGSSDLYFISHAIGPANQVYSSEVRVRSAPAQNDCGTGADAGNTKSSAAYVAVPQSSCKGKLDAGDREDWYRFSASAGKTLRTTVVPKPGTDLDTYLYNSAGLVAYSSYSGSTTEEVYYDVPSSGTYWLRLYHRSGSDEYAMSIALLSPTSPNDCGRGIDAGNSYAGATSLPLPVTNCGGQLRYSYDTYDYYAFSAGSGQTISIDLWSPSGRDFNVCLYDPGGTSQCSSAPVGTKDSIVHTAGSSGTWKMVVYRYRGYGDYALSASVSGAAANDCWTGGDAGDSWATSTTLGLPKTNCPATLASGDTYDYYNFYVPSGKRIDLKMTPDSGLDFHLCLGNPGGSWDVCRATSGSTAEVINHNAGTSGTWTIAVYRGAGNGKYSLSASTTTPAQNDCGTGADAAATWSGAALISLPKSGCKGELNSADTGDLYRFYASSGQQVTLSMSPPSGSNFNLCLYNPSHASMGCSANTGTATESLSVAATSTGYHYAYVYRYSGGGLYTFSASLGSAQNDCGTGTDASNSISSASWISLPKSNCSGALPSGDSLDYYAFSASAGQAINLAMSPSSGANFDLYLYNPSNSYVAGSAYSGSATETISHTASASGTWKVLVYRNSGAGTYSLSASASSGTPSQNDCGTGGDAGNSLGSASSISLPKSNCQGALYASDNVDVYRFYVSSGQTVSLSLVPPSGSNYDVYLYDGANSYKAGSTSGGSTTEYLSHGATSSGWHKAYIYRTSGTGKYSFSASLSSSANDCGTGVDASNSGSSGTIISLPKTNCSGTLSSSDRYDYYRFYVNSGKGVHVMVDPPSSSDFDLYLYDQAGSFVDASAWGGSFTEAVTGSATSSGYWTALVYWRSGGGTYSLSASLGTGQNDCATGADASNSGSSPTYVGLSKYCAGQFLAGDNDDWYRFYATAGKTLHLSVYPDSGDDWDLYLIDSGGNYVDWSVSTTAGVAEHITYSVPSSGWYRLWIDRWGGYGPFNQDFVIA